MVDFAELEKDLRVLILTPTPKDAAITCALLSDAGLNCLVCNDLAHLCRETRAGAGVIVLTEESLTTAGINEFVGVLEQQPSWSDIPIVMLMRGGVDSPSASPLLRALRNVTLLERPAPMRSVLSAVQAALRARERQYQIREQIHAIRLGEQRLQIAIDAAQLGTWQLDLRSGEMSCSERCKNIFGLASHTRPGYQDLLATVHKEDLPCVEEALRKAISDEVVYECEYRVIWPDGGIHWILANGKAIRDEKGAAIAMNGVTIDITARKENEQQRLQLLESERAARAEAERASRMKDEFLATLSHELRTPLNAILGWTQLLKNARDDRETADQAIEVIDRNVKMQSQLISDLLDVSRIVSGKVRLEIQPVDLPEVINAAIEGVRPAADAKGIRIEKLIDTDARAVSGDPSRLQQVFWNLLTNAIKFTPRQGKVQIMTRRVESHIEATVADSGEGIAPAFLPHLFDRFSQADSSSKRRHGGLGLGLSIVKSLVEVHGGNVTAQSEGIGQGSVFVVNLPMRILQRNEAEAPVIQKRKGFGEPALLRGVKVLVVDDEPDARELVRRLLLECDAEAVVASSAEEASELVTTFRPNVILSDIGMPFLDGYEFMRRMRERGITTPAIALTAFARAEDRIRSMQAGFQSHLPKPVEPSELLAVIASLAGRFIKQA